MRRPLTCLVLLLCACVARAELPVLTVYTYGSFVSDWGPGPAIRRAFEADCGCRVEYVAVDDGVALLSRLRLEGARSKADVVLGLDASLLAPARDSGLFAPHRQDLTRLRLPIAWTDDTFLPFDYGWFAFVYDRTRLANPPTSLRELVDGDWRLLIEDPRSSTPGLGLLLWLRQVYGDAAPQAWAKLKPRIVTVTRGWSEAYGLFLKGEAPLVLSYTTSPAYHLIAEGKDQYAAALFREGHYLQVELAARLAAAPQPALAERFLAFVLTPGFQGAIPTGNWMYPVIELPNGLPAGFAAQPQPLQSLLYAPDVLAAGRRAWLDEWLEVLGR